MPRPQPDDTSGPTLQRLKQAQSFFDLAGHSKSSRRYTMYDDALGRAWVRRKISDEEYFGLKRYAHHWSSGGLQSPLQSVDLNRIYAFDPQSMSGVAKTEHQQDHRDAYHAAKERLGEHLGFVADMVVCCNCSLLDVGFMLGYASPRHGRERAGRLLGEAGYRLAKFWEERQRR
jgi:hypothetical protein